MIKNLAWVIIGVNTVMILMGIFLEESAIIINAAICSILAYLSIYLMEEMDE